MQPYSNQWIIYSYKTAKDPDAQIDILSDLTLKSPAAIKSILRAAGCTVNDKKPDKRKMRRDQWTEGEEARLLQLLRDGVPGREIMAQLERSDSSIRTHVHKLQERGYDVVFHIKKDRRVRNKYKAWTAAETAKLEELVAQGFTPISIAECFPGRNYNSVAAKVRTLKQEGA